MEQVDRSGETVSVRDKLKESGGNGGTPPRSFHSSDLVDSLPSATEESVGCSGYESGGQMESRGPYSRTSVNRTEVGRVTGLDRGLCPEVGERTVKGWPVSGLSTSPSPLS